MFKYLSFLVTITTVVSTSYSLVANAEYPQRPKNQITSSNSQEQALLDALSKTAGYKPSVGIYVKEFKRIHSIAKTQQEHSKAQQELNRKYPYESKFFQSFIQKVVNIQNQKNAQLVLQAIARDGKMTPKFKKFITELRQINNAKSLAQAQSIQQQIINKYPNEAKLVIEYTKKLRNK